MQAHSSLCTPLLSVLQFPTVLLRVSLLAGRVRRRAESHFDMWLSVLLEELHRVVVTRLTRSSTRRASEEARQELAHQEHPYCESREQMCVWVQERVCARQRSCWVGGSVGWWETESESQSQSFFCASMSRWEMLPCAERKAEQHSSNYPHVSQTLIFIETHTYLCFASLRHQSWL